MDNLESIFSSFGDTLDKTIEATWAGSTIHLEGMVDAAQVIEKAALKVGDYSFEFLLQNKTASDLTEHYIVNFLWAPQAKAFLILWRDVFFQLQKGKILEEDGAAAAAVLDQLNTESKAAILTAAEELKHAISTELKTIRTSRIGVKGQISSWQKQQNPWPTYQKQISELPEQCQYLQNQYQELQKVATGFRQIKQLISQMGTDRKLELDQVQAQAIETIQLIEETLGSEEDPKLGKVAARLEDLQESVKPPPNLLLFSEQLDQYAKALTEKVQVPVETQYGVIHFKEINFQRNVKQWLESEVLPIYYELSELTESLFNGFKMSLVNIRNRVLLLVAEFKEGKPSKISKEAICQPLITFLKKADANRENLVELLDLIEGRLDSEFRISAIYYSPTDSFLPVPIQSAINQLKLNQNKLITTARDWLQLKAGIIQNFRKTVEQEEALSISEKIVRFVQNAEGDASNHQYSSIFLTKGFIGESFWVGRESELQHIQLLIKNWRSGFRGAVAITGKRFSGKSLFGELVSNRYFGNEMIRLMPDSALQVGGRRTNIGYDLEEALEFIRKHTLNTRPLIWIDDLELWRDPAIPISQNLRVLRRYIDNYSGRMFFLVSMSNWLNHHLKKFHETDRLFQAEINVDRMPLQEIEEAILIRHGATHKSLVDAKGKEINPKQFRKMTSRIYKNAEGNIGEALNRWSASIKLLDDDRVFHQNKGGINLPDFLIPETALLLSAIMMAKRTNEYRLRKLFGPAFSDKYSGVLQRLNSVGLLTRHLDGWLEIKEVAANELGKQLDRKKYLKFYSN